MLWKKSTPTGLLKIKFFNLARLKIMIVIKLIMIHQGNLIKSVLSKPFKCIIFIWGNGC